MNPELLMIESDHDLRNSADFLVIDKIAKAIFRVPGIAPGAGHHPARRERRSSTPRSRSRSACRAPPRQMNQKYKQDRMADMLEQADEMQKTIDTHGQDVRAHPADGRRSRTSMVAKMKGMTVDIAELRDNIANFDDFFRPHAQLLLLGTALLRHPGLLVDPVDVRHPRRHRHDDRRHPEPAAATWSASTRSCRRWSR